jgi:hypothetical protein
MTRFDASPALPSLSRRRAAHLVGAELRQFWWLSPAVLLAGLFVLALLAGVTDRVGAGARTEGVIFNNLGSLLLSVSPLLLAGPVVTGAGSGGRLAFWLGLPLASRTVNRIRLLALACHCWPVLLTWPLILLLLDGVYGPVSPWVVVNSALIAGIGLLLSGRTKFAPFLVYILLPVMAGLTYFIPGARPAGQALLKACASLWTAAALLTAAATLTVTVLRAHPPRPR